MERLQNVLSSFKQSFKNSNKSEELISITTVMRDIFLIDVDVTDFHFHEIERLIDLADNYKSMVNYEMQGNRLRILFHFNRPYHTMPEFEEIRQRHIGNLN